MSSSLPTDAPAGTNGQRPLAAPRARRRPYLLLIFVLTIGSLVPAAVFIAHGADQRGPASPARGDRAPGFAGHTLDGASLSLEGLRGHPVVLHFCASWNPLCADDLRMLTDAEAGTPPRLVFVDVVVDEKADVAQPFYVRQGVDWAVVADPSGRIAAAYGVRAVPQTFFIDARGIVDAWNFGALAPPVLQGRLHDLTS